MDSHAYVNANDESCLLEYCSTPEANVVWYAYYNYNTDPILMRIYHKLRVMAGSVIAARLGSDIYPPTTSEILINHSMRLL